MLLGLFQFKFGGFYKLTANLVFVLGSLAILVTTDYLAASLFVDLYVVGVIVFVLLMRIMISEWNNKTTCKKCENCELVMNGNVA